jgi:hypothetical protein
MNGKNNDSHLPCIASALPLNTERSIGVRQFGNIFDRNFVFDFRCASFQMHSSNLQENNASQENKVLALKSVIHTTHVSQIQRTFRFTTVENGSRWSKIQI